ncbi:hypothetical protein ODE01S_12330 [Oceanithermus desulfurans NBRC 100063]|uniref:Uncharacterized protein n=1 Tax=Oceanithermus desulfurans NBRC 100063 TaxID=1227550 RepID=A0A511RJG8_9DEIN|nr:hypothetical protein ODE01S_12330 [Oceanithermus desulfurans NBRC 100063]
MVGGGDHHRTRSQPRLFAALDRREADPRLFEPPERTGGLGEAELAGAGTFEEGLVDGE